jgi:hypothetical protein
VNSEHGTSRPTLTDTSVFPVRGRVSDRNADNADSVLRPVIHYMTPHQCMMFVALTPSPNTYRLHVMLLSDRASAVSSYILTNTSQSQGSHPLPIPA